MEREVAIKKLGKILGKSLGYRVDPTAPDQEGRDKARAKMKDAGAKRDALRKQKDARMSALLQGDAEFQQLKAALTEAQKHCDELMGIASHYKITVGVSNSIFFEIKAQGDSWEDVIAKLTQKQAA